MLFIIIVDGQELQPLSTPYQSSPYLHSVTRQPSSHYSRNSFLPEERMYSYPSHQFSEQYRYENVHHYVDGNPDKRLFHPVSPQRMTNRIPYQVNQRVPPLNYGKSQL